MRLLGIHWLSSIMYPEYYTQNINDEIKAFYKLFFNFDLDDDTLSKITKAAF